MTEDENWEIENKQIADLSTNTAVIILYLNGLNTAN